MSRVIAAPALPIAYTQVRGTRRIDMIVVHCTAGRRASDLPILQGRDPKRRVSAHAYTTNDGTRYDLVADNDIAYHAGLSAWQGERNCNLFSLGLELENLNNGRDPYPAVQIDAAVAWCVEKVNRYAIRRDRFVRHLDISGPAVRTPPKTDPWALDWSMFCDRVFAYGVGRYRVRWDSTYTRTRPSIDAPRAWATLPKGLEIDIAAVVPDEQPVEPLPWAHWPPAGFIRIDQLERVGT